MRKFLVSALAVFLLGSPAPAWSQSAQEIFDKHIAMDAQRKRSVSNYTIDQTMFGRNMLVYYEKIEGVGPDGVAYSSFRLVMPDEIAERQSNGAAMGPEEIKIYARGIEVIGGQIDGGVGGSSMTGSLATFLRAAATSRQNRDRDDNADALSEAQSMAYFASVAELVGIESIDGTQAFHVRATDLNYSQPAEEGQEFIVNTVSLWIDTLQYVSLKLRMDGVVVQNGQSRDMYLEKIDTDYRPAGPLYESYKQIMRMGGVLSPAQRAEMAESEVQIANLEAQMESMPDDQKAMMERMIGPQIDMLRNMIDGGGIQIETIVNEIRVNAGLPDATEMGIKMMQISPMGTSVTPPATNYAPATASTPASTPASAAASTAASTADPAALQAAQQSCLQERIAVAQESQKKKRGFGRLLSAVSRTAMQFGNYDVARTASQVYSTSATADDLSAAAKDLGLTEDDVQACQNPL